MNLAHKLWPGIRQQAADGCEAGGQPGTLTSYGSALYEGKAGPDRATLPDRSRRIATTMDQGG